MSLSTPLATGPTALLGLGSNLGDRRGNLVRALGRLARDPGTRILAISPLYAADPVGLPGAPEFLNAAAQLRTGRSPEGLLALCLGIEAEFGRIRSNRTESRTIDLDLLTYGGVRQKEAALYLPHPRLTERAFVLLPLAEIAPEEVVEGRTIAEWARAVDARGVRRLDDPAWPPGLG